MKLFFTLAALAVVNADNEESVGQKHMRSIHIPGPLSQKTHVKHQETRGLTESETTMVCTVEHAGGEPAPGDDHDSGSASRVCQDRGIGLTPEIESFLMNVPGATSPVTDGYGSYSFLESLRLYAAENYIIGGIDQLIVEAGDASISGATVEDGKSGDISFPFGEIRPIVTAGERSVCDESYGETVVGKPDGMGAYLKDDETVRVLFQSESYGPLTNNEAWAYPVNNGAAMIGGSHINAVDYDREMMSNFLDYSGSASDMVVGFEQAIKKVYNLRNQLVGARNKMGTGYEPTPVGAHLSNTDANGVWAFEEEYFPRIDYDWFIQSLCSAHMEEAHQWGEGIGFEDDMFITNEEWHRYGVNMSFVGNSYHALDVATSTFYAVGATSLGGFEKPSEINPQHSDYVMLAISGYNGAYGDFEKVLDDRNAAFGTRADGQAWVRPNNIHPYRFYLGKKGVKEDGTPANDFLSRNGLRYGRIYGFAIDMSATGPTGGKWRDLWHKEDATNGAEVTGKWVAEEWRWDGTVENFEHDGSWNWQDAVPGEPTLSWWNGNGNDEGGAKTEHLSPDSRPGFSAYIQTSTAGYFGHAYIDGVVDALNAVVNDADPFPASFEGRYFAYQGETDIRSQVNLGGKGEYVPDVTGAPRNATCNYDSQQNATDCKSTFEDIDGFEVICGAGDCCRAILQEDSGNDLGERCFISSCLEHEADGEDLTYYLVAISGGQDNTRIAAGVGIPKTSNDGAGAHEFSGVFDLSGLLRKEGGAFVLSASDPGYKKREQEKLVPFNEKYIMINVQASNMNDRIMVDFGSDTGGQVMIYRPNGI